MTRKVIKTDPSKLHVEAGTSQDDKILKIIQKVVNRLSLQITLQLESYTTCAFFSD